MSRFAITDQDLIRKLTEIILANLSNENFGVSELAKETGMNYFSLNRKLRSIVKKTTSQFINEVRLQRAKEILEQEDITAAEVGYRVGYSSPAYFSRCFNEYFGYPPGEIKKRGVSELEEIQGQSSLKSKTEDKVMKDLDDQPQYKVKFRRKGIILVAITTLFLTILSIFYFFPLINSSKPPLYPPDKSIAILPFKNLSKEADYLYFAEGVTESVLNNLMYIEKIKVISLITTEIDQPESHNASEIIKRTGANYILSGSAQYNNGRFRIMVQLTDARNKVQIGFDPMEGEMTDIFKVQSDIAKKIANKLQSVLSQKEIKLISKIPTKNTKAWTSYLKGRYFLNRREIGNSVECFQQAIAADPNFAEAYAGLGEAFFQGTKVKIFPRDEGYSKSKDYIKQALELDSNLVDAYATLGALLCFDEWKWEAAREEYQKAILLNPNCAAAHQNYGELLLILREFKDARAHLTLAKELEPISSLILNLSAHCFVNEGKFPEALEECRQITELNPGFLGAPWLSFNIYIRTGEELKAIDTIEKALSILEWDKKYAVQVKGVYQRSGMTGLYNLLVEYESENLESGIMGLAKLYIWLGDKNKALGYLEKAMAMEKRYPGLPGINCDMDFEKLRDEPRFQALLKKMGLSAYQTIRN